MGNCRKRITNELSETFSEKLGVVMLDVWQVACAIELRAEAFWTFDRDREMLASAAGRFKPVVGLD